MKLKLTYLLLILLLCGCSHTHRNTCDGDMVGYTEEGYRLYCHDVVDWWWEGDKQ